MSGSTTWWPFGRCGSSSCVADLRRRREVELAADRGASRRSSPARGCTRSRPALAGHGVDQPAAGPEEVGAGVADDRVRRSALARSSARACGGVGPGRRRRRRPRRTRREDAMSAISDRNQSPLASPSAAESQRVDRHRRRERRAPSGGRLHQPEEGGDPHVALPDRQEPASGPGCRRTSACIEAARSSVRLRQRRVLRAERGVAPDLLVGRLRVPEEVAGRVDADHHRAVDALRVAPGVDHRRARAGALAERGRCGRSRAPCARPRGRRPAAGSAVAGEIDAVVLAAASAQARNAVGVRARSDFSPRKSVECLQRRLDLGAVEPRRSRRRRGSRRGRRRGLSANRLAFGNVMFVMPGPPWRRKIGSAGCAERARMRVTGSAISRDRGLARFSGTTSVPQSAA